MPPSSCRFRTLGIDATKFPKSVVPDRGEPTTKIGVACNLPAIRSRSFGVDVARCKSDASSHPAGPPSKERREGEGLSAAEPSASTLRSLRFLLSHSAPRRELVLRHGDATADAWCCPPSGVATHFALPAIS